MDNEFGFVPLEENQLPTQQLAVDSDGFTPISESEALYQEEKVKYDSPIAAATLGALRGATVGLSDVAARGLGYEDQVRKYKEYNPQASTAGEVAGTVASAFTGPGALITKASLAATQGLSKGLTKKAIANIIEGAAYGGAQAISDIALKKTNDIAENIITNISLGGLTGGVLSIAGHGISRAASGTKDLIKKGFKLGDLQKASDDAALQFIGGTGADIRRLEPARAASMSEMIRNAMTDNGQKPFKKAVQTSLEDLVEKVQAIKDNAGKYIGDFDDGISKVILDKAKVDIDEGKILFNYSEQGLPPLDDVVQFLRGRAANLGEQIGFQNEAGKIKALADDIQSKFTELYNFNDLVELRRNVDKLLPKKAFENQLATPEMSAYFDVLRDYRRFLQDKILKAAENVQELYPQEMKKSGLDLAAYKAANNQYGTASQIIKLANKGLAKEAARPPLTAVDYMITGYGVASPAALAMLGLKKGYEKFSRQALIIAGKDGESSAINGLSKIMHKEDSLLKDKAKDFAQNFKLGLIGTSTIPVTSIFEKDYEQKFSDIQDMAQNPELFSQKMQDEVSGIGNIDAQLQQAIINKTAIATQFLSSKLPKNPFINDAFPSHIKWKPSASEVAKFNRYLKAADDPFSIMDDLKAGVLTPEAVESVKTIYPETYNKIVQSVMNEMAMRKEPPTLNQKLQLSILLNQPIVGIQDIQMMQRLQMGAQAAGQMEQSQQQSPAMKSKKIEGDFLKGKMGQSEQLIRSRGE